MIISSQFVKLSEMFSFHNYGLCLLAHTSQLLFDSRQMEVSAQQEHSRLSDQLNAVQQLQPATGHRFSSQTLCCLFSTWQLQGSVAVNQSCGKERWKSAVVERWERETTHCFLSLSPMNVSQVTKGTCIKELYIANKWWALQWFFLVLPLSKEARALKGKVVSATAAEPLWEPL